MQNITQPGLSDDQVDLLELFRALWKSKILVIGSTVTFAAIFLMAALIMPDKYISSTVLAPTNPQAGGLPRALSNYSGLASLAGFNLDDGASESEIAEQIIESWGFIESFIERNNLQVQIYAASGWSEETNSLVIDDDIYDVENKKWLILGDEGQLRAPTSWELYKRFSGMLGLSRDSINGLTKLSIEFYSPYIAKEWVDLIVQDINSYMQQRRLSKVNRNIEYLQAQVEKTSIADMEQVFYTLIEEQIKSKMLVEATPEYTFIVVNQSMVPEEKSEPKEVFWLIVGSLLGFIASMLIVIIRHTFLSPSKLLLK